MSGSKKEQYLVLARKWRPQVFEDLVGQEHITRTLQNSIKSNRVAHAFLFAGSRGVGKTSAARILAKCLNCTGGDEPSPVPCNECASCVEITDGRSIDVFEIDGASNTSVDDIRNLRENIQYMPASSRYKIYIIDEIHMISKSAFNALLKTLEEPPRHAYFIFATTEAHKIPVTILSRCQRFDFKRISTPGITKRLEQIGKHEKIKVDEDALMTISRESEGSMRDAESILDQVIAYAGEKITLESVVEVLGIIDRKVLYQMSGAILGRDPRECLRILDDLYNQGYDVGQLARDLLRHFRDLTVAKVAGDPPSLIDLPEAEIEDLLGLASQAEYPEFLCLFDIMKKGLEDVMRTTQQKLMMEVTLVRMARLEPMIPLDEITSRLEAMEKRLGEGAVSPVGSAPGKAVQAEPPQRPNPPERAVRQEAREVEPVPEGRADEPAAAADDVVGGDEWATVLRRVKEDSPSLSAILDQAQEVSFAGDKLSIGFTDSFARDMLREPERMKVFKNLLKEYHGKRVEVEVGNVQAEEANAEGGGGGDSSPQKRNVERETLENPAVKEAIDTLGGRVVAIKPVKAS